MSLASASPAEAGSLTRFFDRHGTEILIGLALTLLGVLLAELTVWIKKRRRIRKEVEENRHINLAGDWFAAWESSIDGQIVINTEHVIFRQKGSEVYIENTERSPENPIGGYLWRARLTFSCAETLMGVYYPLPEEHITSRGVLYLIYDSQRRTMAGRWVGKSYDGSLCNGFAFICKNRDISKLGVGKLISLSKEHSVNILSANMINGITLELARETAPSPPALP